MKVALGQFAVSREWQENLNTCLQLMEQAAKSGADLLVLPEAVLAQDMADPVIAVKSAQPLTGPFVTHLLAQSLKQDMTTVLGLHVLAADGRVFNTLLALRQGEIIVRYNKLHLYDAFAIQESANIIAGETVPPLLKVADIQTGLMTCYDIRFPELARRLVLDGADLLVLPSAWVRGPLKEMHWEVLVTARALENTCYLVAVGECGPRNIGNSMVVDPLGVVIARAAEAPGLLFADIDSKRVAYARNQLPVLANRRFITPKLDNEG
ncbi:deaminated glutathione amidase [Enterobacteriaceae bacterium LUAb1]